jgi:hypothetical protein
MWKGCETFFGKRAQRKTSVADAAGNHGLTVAEIDHWQ